MQAAIDMDRAVIDLAAKCSLDPLKWTLSAYDWGHGELAKHKSPRQWQISALADIRDALVDKSTRHQPIRIARASGHGIGKSALIGMIVNWALSTMADTKVIVTANTDTQLRTKTSPEIAKWQRLSLTADWWSIASSSISSVENAHAKTWRADLIPWSEHNTEAFAGLHNEGKRIVLIFDEASAIADKVWEVAEGALTDEATQIIWVVFGNGTRATGRFRECFRRNRHRWNTAQIDSRDVEGTNKQQIQQWIDDYGIDSDFVKVRVRGMFPSSSSKQFISVDLVDAALGKHLRPEQYNFAPVIITCDPAWSGDDELVIAKRQGLAFSILRTIPKNDNDIQIATIIAQIEDQEQADAVFVDAGYGTGIVSAGQTMGRSWMLVWFSGASDDPGCLNKRAEMWDKGRQWLVEGGALPNDQVLYHDLIGVEVVSRLDGKKQLESKDSMKERGLPSPNRGDAWALSFAYPVVSKRTSRIGGNVHQAKTKTSPWS